MKTIVEIREGECRWPVKTTKRDHLFCAEPVVKGRPYCACHRALSLDPDQTRTPKFHYTARK